MGRCLTDLNVKKVGTSCWLDSYKCPPALSQVRRYNNYVQFLLALSQTDHSFNIYQTRMKIYIASFLFFLKMSLWTRSSCIHVCLGDGLGSYPGTWVINQLSFYLLPPCSLQTAHFSFLRIFSYQYIMASIVTILVPRGMPPDSRECTP